MNENKCLPSSGTWGTVTAFKVGEIDPDSVVVPQPETVIGSPLLNVISAGGKEAGAALESSMSVSKTRMQASLVISLL